MSSLRFIPVAPKNLVVGSMAGSKAHGNTLHCPVLPTRGFLVAHPILHVSFPAFRLRLKPCLTVLFIAFALSA